MEITKEWLETEYIGKNRTLGSLMVETGKSKSFFYRRLKRYGLRKNHSRPLYNISLEWLSEQYLVKLRSTEDIANEVGCSIDLIKDLCSINQLKRGSDYRRTEDGRKRHSRKRSDEERKKQGDALVKVDFGYTRRRVGSGRRYMHRTIAEEILGRQLSSDEVVHHIDLGKTNHYPDNLLVMSRFVHQILHLTLKVRPETDQIAFLDLNEFEYEELPNDQYSKSDTLRRWLELVGR